MKVEWAEEARYDLREILLYLEYAFGLDSAQRALDEINRSVETLKRFPFMGKGILEDPLIIVAIWDNRKDPEQLEKRLIH